MSAKFGKVQRQDIVIRDNATFTMPMIVKDRGGAIVNITGWDAKMQMRYPKDGSLLAQFTVGSGLTITGAQGKVELKIQPATIGAWTFTNGWYDLIVTDTVGDKFCYIEGTFEVEVGVTQ